MWGREWEREQRACVVSCCRPTALVPLQHMYRSVAGSAAVRASIYVCTCAPPPFPASACGYTRAKERAREPRHCLRRARMCVCVCVYIGIGVALHARAPFFPSLFLLSFARERPWETAARLQNLPEAARVDALGPLGEELHQGLRVPTANDTLRGHLLCLQTFVPLRVVVVASPPFPRGGTVSVSRCASRDCSSPVTALLYTRHSETVACHWLRAGL